jgi:hypothetical protein
MFLKLRECEPIGHLQCATCPAAEMALPPKRIGKRISLEIVQNTTDGVTRENRSRSGGATRLIEGSRGDRGHGPRYHATSITLWSARRRGSGATKSVSAAASSTAPRWHSPMQAALRPKIRARKRGAPICRPICRLPKAPAGDQRVHGNPVTLVTPVIRYPALTLFI